MEHLQGRRYESGLAITGDRVRAFVDATTDDPRRWAHHAPPSYAAAALFAVAPAFLFDEAVGDYSRTLMHADQMFVYHAPFEVGMDLEIDAVVERVRMRGEVAWVTFVATVAAAGSVVAESSSVFLMSADAPPAHNEERPEPPPMARRRVDLPGGITMHKSASRSDLIRYAAASGDFNPLHWDHGTAVAAGLPGVVAHGLLTAAWATQVVPKGSNAVLPIRTARFRFPRPVLPDTQLVVTGSRPEEGSMSATVTEAGGDEPAVTAAFELA